MSTNILSTSSGWVESTNFAGTYYETTAQTQFNGATTQWEFAQSGTAGAEMMAVRYETTQATGDVMELSVTSPSLSGARVRIWLTSTIGVSNGLYMHGTDGSTAGFGGDQSGLPPADFDQILTAGQTYTFNSQTTPENPVIFVDTLSGSATSMDVIITPTAVESAPSATFTWTSGGANGLTVNFTDTSTQVGGAIGAWNWAFGDGQSSTTQSPQHTYSAGGAYSVQLTVTSSTGSGLSGNSTTVINIPALTASFTETSSGLTATFASNSFTAPAYTISTYYWDFGDGHTQSGAAGTVSHTYANPGTYNASLMVQDTSTGTPISTAFVRAITVAATGSVNQPPTVAFAAAVTDLSVAFTDQTTSAASTIVSWLWAFGDGATSTVQNPTHSYSMAGTFTVTLTATDALGNSASLSNTVLTQAPGSSTTPDTATYTLKGFLANSGFVNNSPNVVAALGELSTLSQTFARDTAVFGTSTTGELVQAIEMTVFGSQNANGAYASVPSDYATTLLGMSTWIYAQAQSGAFTSDASVFQQALLAQYASVIQSVSSGPMVQQNAVWLPTYMEFFFQAASSVSPSNTSNSRMKLWFSDSAFRNEYDLYQIAYIPPITNLDDFFGSASAVQAEVNARTLPQTTTLIQQAANGDPYTVLEAAIFNWVDPNNSTHLIPTNWTYIIWGLAGNNVDAIKEGLQSYILDNSTHSRAEWAAIFPDIFQTTEFILTPLWTQYAIPNNDVVVGMYSPVVNPNTALQYAEETAIGTGYTPQFVQNYMNIVPVAYKNMAIIAVGGPQNEGSVSEFAKQWTDYLSVPTSSTDFDRMQEDTQGYILAMNNLLLAAESMTAATDLPSDITRLTRTNANGDVVMYAVMSYNSIDYLCVTKDFMVQKYGANTNTTASIAISYDGVFVNGAYQLLSAVTTMNLQFVAQNAVLPTQFAIIGTDVGAASIDANTGLFTGTFAAEGPYVVTLSLSDAQGHSAQQTFNFNYQQPSGGSTALGITSASFPSSSPNGQPYSGTALIAGGTSPYTVVTQTLPTGLSAAIDQNQLSVSGTPNATGTMTASITVQDSANPPAQATTSWSVTITP